MESNQAWSEVGQHFSDLGQRLKHHYQQPGSSDKGDKVDEALRGLADSLGRALDAVGTAARDPELAQQSKATARSLAQAVGVTFGEVSDQLGRRFRPGDDRPEESDGPTPPNDPA